jgi:hypothetical protein
MADILVSSSHNDTALVDRCVAWLRTFGVTVCLARTDDAPAEATEFRAACFFFSTASFEDAALLQQIHAVAMANKPVLLVLLDDIELSRLRSLPVLDVHSLNVVGLNTAQIGEALVALFPKLGVLRAPLRSILRPLPPNEPRKVVVTRARVRFAAVAVIVLSLAFFVRSRFSHEVKPAPKVEMQIVETKPTPASTSAPTPPPTPTPAVKEQPPAPPPTLTSHEERAIVFVTQCVASSSRENGMGDDQIAGILSFFADPSVIGDKGKQPRALLRSSMVQRARELPKYHEAVESIKIESSPDPSVVRVLTKISYFGENLVEQTRAQGGWDALFEVKFGDDDQPLITRIDYPKPRP